MPSLNTILVVKPSLLKKNVAQSVDLFCAYTKGLCEPVADPAEFPWLHIMSMCRHILKDLYKKHYDSNGLLESIEEFSLLLASYCYERLCSGPTEKIPKLTKEQRKSLIVEPLFNKISCNSLNKKICLLKKKIREHSSLLSPVVNAHRSYLSSHLDVCSAKDDMSTLKASLPKTETQIGQSPGYILHLINGVKGQIQVYDEVKMDRRQAYDIALEPEAQLRSDLKKREEEIIKIIRQAIREKLNESVDNLRTLVRNLMPVRRAQVFQDLLDSVAVEAEAHYILQECSLRYRFPECENHMETLGHFEVLPNSILMKYRPSGQGLSKWFKKYGTEDKVYLGTGNELKHDKLLINIEKGTQVHIPTTMDCDTLLHFGWKKSKGLFAGKKWGFFIQQC